MSVMLLIVMLRETQSQDVFLLLSCWVRSSISGQNGGEAAVPLGRSSSGLIISEGGGR